MRYDEHPMSPTGNGITKDRTSGAGFDARDHRSCVDYRIL